MDVFKLVRTIIIALILLAIIFSIWGVSFAAYMVYSHTLVRRPGKTWGRQISEQNDQLQIMWDRGIEWSKEFEKYKKEIRIKSFDKLQLVAEFYDYGFDKTVIIMPGRRECLIYSYYYARPYFDLGINVLVVDQRAHGLSEGKYATAGILEAKDIIDWAKYLHDSFNQKTIYLHGICVGTCCSTNVLIDENCPSYIKAAVYDSCFINYKEIFGNHMMELGHKLWPTFDFIWMWFKFYTKQDINNSNPLRFINKVKVPICFIWGKKDAYCLPDKSEEIYKKCSSSIKEIHWFDEGTHSKLRLCDESKYDQIVTDFFSKY